MGWEFCLRSSKLHIEKLEQGFGKQFQGVKNDKEIYIQLRNIQH
jgi:hypothetical protein